MNINAVTISVNCHDLLAHTLPSTKNCFNRLVIVTSKDDEETKKICSYWHVECISTDLFYKDGAKFNKGLGIQFGLDYLKSDDWVVCIDADIYLPPRFNEFIRCRTYNKDCIYGIDRLDIKDWDTWIKFYSNPTSLYYTGWVNPTHQVMYRFLDGSFYLPIGYFQMWNSKSRYAKNGYPIIYENAADSDVDFAKYWPPENRILIPETFVYHLSTKKDSKIIGEDWSGRKSPRFGPSEVNK